MNFHKSRHTYRVRYRLKIQNQYLGQVKYARAQTRTNALALQLENLEAATRTGIAAATEIESWIARGRIKTEEAELAFPGFTETSARSSVCCA